MSDPKRLLEAGGNASELERELLAREITTLPSEKLEQAVWQRVLVALPPIGPGSPGGGNGAGGDGGLSGTGAAGGSTGGAAAGGASAAAASTGAGGVLVGAAKASGLGVAKALAIGVFAGTVAVTGAAELSERVAPGVTVPADRRESAAEPVLEPPAPRLRSAAAAAPSLPAPTLPASRRSFARSDEAIVPPAQPGSASARFEMPTSDLASRTRAERLALERARQALRGGDPGTALTLVEGASQTGSVLAQEREVLAIEALSAAGRSAEARTRARSFMSRFPGSPHQNHVVQFAR